MKLSPAAFNQFLAHIGQRFLWRRAYDCPCINPHSGAARHDCPHCAGKGQVWDEPIEGVAGAAGYRVQREWAQFGVWESGDLVVTIPSNSPLYAMGQFDRVTMLNGTEPFSLTFTRGHNDVLQFPVERIDRVFWYDDDDSLVDGGIPTVAADGTLHWDSDEPPAGKRYSISGTKRTEFYCWGEFPSNRNMHSGEPLPRRVVLRRFDLFSR